MNDVVVYTFNQAQLDEALAEQKLQLLAASVDIGLITVMQADIRAFLEGPILAEKKMRRRWPLRERG